MKYSIIIPTYNHCDDLLKPCLESIFAHTDMADVELIISANGCKDNTQSYLASLFARFQSIGFEKHLKVLWSNKPLGYSGANNLAIPHATADKIVLLNNDTVLLHQKKNQWLEMLHKPFESNPNCGISCVIKGPSEPAGHDFAIFFCVMIDRKVFDAIGLLNTEYGVGGGEDTEFCIEAERAGFEVCECSEKTWGGNQFVGAFPIYHKGEGTVHDPNLVKGWDDIFLRNSLKLAKKYNRDWYRWRLSNHAERGVFLKGDTVYPREVARYTWAAQHIKGKKVLEIGCSSGFGVQFLPASIDYVGIDYDPIIIEAAQEQGWGNHAKFVHADIHTFELGQYDTIIAFEVIEHLDNGLQVLERLKKHCKTLLFTVPNNESPGPWSPHHKLHHLTEAHFPGFSFSHLNEHGHITLTPAPIGANNRVNLLLGCWHSHETLAWICDLGQDAKELFDEVIRDNIYQVSEDNLKGRAVIDIGANIGTFSMLAAKLGASKVVAVEPVTTTFDTLKHNIEKANAQSVVVPQKAVVLDEDNKSVQIGLNNNCGHNSLYQASLGAETVSSVSLKSLLNMVDGDDVFLKMDCEGAEYDILMHVSPQDMERVSTVAMEVHLDLHPKYQGLEVIEQKLQSFGMKLADRKQLGAWDFDGQGNMINYRPLPRTNEIWVRA